MSEPAPEYLTRYRRREGEQQPNGTDLVETATERAANRPDDAPAPSVRPSVAGTAVRLIRHGETQSYAADSGLTPWGRWQAFHKGTELAAAMRGLNRVVLPHAPTARAKATADALLEGLRYGMSRLRIDENPVDEPRADHRFDNFRIWCGGPVLEPTQAFQRYQEARRTHREEGMPGWVTEMDRFMNIQAAGGEPIEYWLTQPLQYFEPSSAVVARFWRGIARLGDDLPTGAAAFVSTHSGCIRAIATSALGHDPGEPANAEDVRIRLLPGGRAVLTFRARSVELDVPADGSPWFPE